MVPPLSATIFLFFGLLVTPPPETLTNEIDLTASSSNPEPATIGRAPVLLGLSEQEMGLWQAAVAAFNLEEFGRAQEILAPMAESKHPEVLNLLGAVSSELGEKETAIAYFRQSLLADPGNFWARFNLAETHLLMGEFEAARRQFFAIPTRNPAERELIQFKLVFLALKMDQPESVSQQLPAWPPQSAYGQAAYALLAVHEGRPARAQAILETAKAKFPEQWDAFLRRTLREANLPDLESPEVH
jgi:tetratricopeptide (TPR) repeat protein